MKTRYVPIKCGNCIECRKQKAREWQVRMLEDIKTNTNGKMITLTFSNEAIKELTEAAYDLNEQRIQQHYKSDGKKGRKNTRAKRLEGYELDNEIATIAIRRFNERWRKKYKTALRHWLVTELGHKGTENIHLHGIVWTDETMEEIEKIWGYGFIWKGEMVKGKRINYVNEKTVNYTIKYISKIDIDHKTYKSKILTSAGIGKEYINTHNSTKNKFKGSDTNENYTTRTGNRIALPTYWRNKLWTDEERIQLWSNRLDKQIKWIRGEKVDISKGDENYKKLLEWHRRINAELGYGSNTKDWKRHKYETERRKALQKARIQNTK